jgi:lauroyl/myristoyl acyltransferase
MANLRLRLSFHLTRGLERILPVMALYWILKRMIFVRAMWHGALRNPPPKIILPSFFKRPGVINCVGMDMINLYLNNRIGFFPERLSSAKWMSRCGVFGLEHIRQARQNGRPVVLAFPHFGPYHQFGYWLRALGLPVATIVGGEMENRTSLNRLKSQKSPFPNLPTAFYLDQLPQAVKFLRSGNLLLVAVDTPQGKQLDVPFREGWSFEMPTGALRLAIRHEAELIFCSIVETGPWRFRIEFGEPVPKEYLKDETDLIAAAKYLVNQMLVQFEKYPEQGRKIMLRRFRQISPAAITEQPANEFRDSDQFVM